MEWGGVITKLSDKAIEQLDPPILDAGLEFYYKAYQELTSERSVGMGVGLIPWSSVVGWCHHYGISDINEIDVVYRYIRALEIAENKWQAKRSQSNTAES